MTTSANPIDADDAVAMFLCQRQGTGVVLRDAIVFNVGLAQDFVMKQL